MRRLDLKPQKKLRNPERHIRTLEKWSRSFEGFFPTREMTPEEVWYENIPVFEKVVSPPHTNSDLQRRCAQLLIDAAECMRDARPPELSDGRIYVWLEFPHMFDSSIEVSYAAKPPYLFRGENYFGRHDYGDAWIEFFEIGFNRIEDLGLRIPPGFHARGSGARRFEPDWMTVPFEYDRWAIGEIDLG